MKAAVLPPLLYCAGAGYYRRVSAGRPEPTTSSGSGLCICLNDQEMQEDLLADWGQAGSDVVVLALGEGPGSWFDPEQECCFAVKEDGSCWWSANLPPTLYKKVHGRLGSHPNSPVSAVDYVALGPEGNYFVQFWNGHQAWVGPASLSAALNSKAMQVELLAFAADDGWYVMWEDGSQAWENIPAALATNMLGRRTSMGADAAAATVEGVALGPSGEWWVRYANGDTKKGGLCDSMQVAYAHIRSQGHEVASVVFGCNNSWAIRY